jgi:acetyl-CoA carboxylase biotin carboxyl carrier protein
MDSNELKELRELVEILKASDVAEFAWSKGEVTLELKFQGDVPVAAPGLDMAQIAQLMASQQQAPQVVHAQVAAAPVAAVESAPAVQHHIVKSPIVGTFYESPSPGSPAFVKVGDVVEVGQVLCIVEAMKLMNEIEADAAGEIVERIAVTGQPVEYGQPLFAIKAR